MTTRSVLRTIYDNTYCPFCGAIPDTPCHDIHGDIVSPHTARVKKYHALSSPTLPVPVRMRFAARGT